MFWSTKKTTSISAATAATTATPTIHNSGITTYNYPSTGSNSTVYVTSGGGGGAGFSGSSSGVVTLPIASGSSGMYLSSSSNMWTSHQTGTINNTVSISGTIVINSEDPIIKTKKHSIDLNELYENIQILNEMFSVIVPNKKKMEDHPTLKYAYEEYNNAKLIEPKYNSEEYRMAYEQYKLLETLVKEQHDNS